MPSDPDPSAPGSNTPIPPRIADYTPAPAPTAVPPQLAGAAVPGAMPPAASAPPAIFEGRLHPMTLVFNAWSLVRGFIIPAILVLFFGSKGFMGGFVLVFIMLPMAVAIIRYFTFTYRIQGGELITAHGLLGRTERNIPLARVQDIRIEQGVLHRMFGMADVHVETAGGRGAEASLSVLAKDEAEHLRAAVFEQVSLVRGSAAPAAAPAEREVIRALSLRELVVAGLTSNQVASVLALLAVGMGIVDDIVAPETYERWTTAFGRSIEQFGKQGLENTWMQLLAGAGLLMAVGMAFSVVGSVLLFYGFTLSRSGEDIHRSFGLLTRRTSSLPRRRIQLLKIEEKLLRRCVGLATIRADTAGAARRDPRRVLAVAMCSCRWCRGGRSNRC